MGRQGWTQPPRKLAPIGMPCKDKRLLGPLQMLTHSRQLSTRLRTLIAEAGTRVASQNLPQHAAEMPNKCRAGQGRDALAGVDRAGNCLYASQRLGA